ncbi:MAG: pyridoxal 5'-phosphate synthase glutaminase subunit PdxT [Acidobacteriota bacterium]
MIRTKTIGVLSLQGDFEAHRHAIEREGARATEVRTPEQLAECDALIIPGGESTTMLKLLDIQKLTDPLKAFAAEKPVFGTCAGAILLAHLVTNPKQPSLGLLDIDVERNAYGRQIDSRIAQIETADGPTEAVFIRAPIIRRAGTEARVLATYEKNPVWVQQGRHMVTTFHPELSADSPVHRRFLLTVCEKP